MQNLRDKLMKAGLVSKDQAKQVEAEKATAAPPPREYPPERPERPSDRGGERSERPRFEARGPGGGGGGGGRTGGRPGGPGGSGGFQGGRPAGGPGGGAQRSGARPPPRHSAPSGHAAGKPREPAYEVPIRKLPPLTLPGTPAYQRLQSLKQLELDKKLRDLVRSAEVPVELGERMFHFVTRKGRLRRMALSEAQAKLLEEGLLAVVECPEPAQIEHCLVPPEAAESVSALSPKAVRFFNKAGSPIGFLSEDELTRREAAEASGEAAAEETAQDAAAAKAAAPAPTEAAAAESAAASQAEVVTSVTLPKVDGVQEPVVSGEINLAGIATEEENDEGF